MKTKSVVFTLLIILGITLLAILIWNILLIQAFTWKPPNTDLELTKSEIAWKKNVQSVHKLDIEWIGLDDSFMEDSIIYMNIKVDSTSSQQTELLDSMALKTFTRTLASGFHRKSKGREEQTCIQLRFYNILNNELGEKYKHPISKSCRYHLKNGTTTIIH